MTTDRKAEGATGGRWGYERGSLLCEGTEMCKVTGLTIGNWMAKLLNAAERAPTGASLRALREAYEAGHANVIPGDRTALYDAIRAVLASPLEEPDKTG